MARLIPTSFALILTTALLFSIAAIAEQEQPNSNRDPNLNPNQNPNENPNHNPNQNPNRIPNRNPHRIPNRNPHRNPHRNRNQGTERDPNWETERDPHGDPNWVGDSEGAGAGLRYSLEDETDTEGMETDEEKVATEGLCKCRKHHRHKRHRNHTRPAFSSRDVDELNVILNAEYVEAEFFLHAAYGYGLDRFNGTAVNVTGPPPVGAQKAHTGRFIEHLAKEFGLQSLGHIREISSKLGDKAIARPTIDISRHVWGGLFNEAFGKKLKPAFDPYTTGNHFLLAAYMLPYVSYTGLVALNAHSEGKSARDLVARLAGVKGAEDASIRTVLYQRKRQVVERYNMTVGEFTAVLSALREKLDGDNHTMIDPKKGNTFTLPVTIDEGVLVSGSDTPENLLTGNIITVNANSLSVGRSPEQILQVLYGTGNASIPGLFFPQGANGKIATKYLSAVSLLA